MASRIITKDFLKFLYQIGKISDAHFLMNTAKERPITIEELAGESNLEDANLSEILDLYDGMVKTNLDTLDPEVVKMLPEEMCIEEKLLPFAVAENSIMVAVADPTSPGIADMVLEATGFVAILFLVDLDKLAEKQKELFAKSTEFKKYGSLAETDVEQKAVTLGLYNIPSESSNIEKMVDALVMFAVQKETTDIHIEASQKKIEVFFRVKKQLAKIHNFDILLKDKLKLHLIARTDKLITGKDVPHEGSFFVHDTITGLRVNVRISIIYSVDGYSIVLRLLREIENDLEFQEEKLLELNTIDHASDISQVINSCVGLMIITGPTSSGKTTLLHDIIKGYIPTEKKLKIISVEDPVELTSSEIIKTESKDLPGRGLEDMIKFCLRQNPDILIIGETREARTAELLIRSAMSSILVLTTMHSKNAIEAVSLLSGWGIDKTSIASCLKYIIAARLVKILCKHCKKPEKDLNPYSKIIKQLQIETNTKYFKPDTYGCEHCSYSGYLGLFSLQEHFVLNETLLKYISQGELHSFSVTAKEHIAKESLRYKVIQLLQLGLVSLDEAAKLGLESVQV